MEGFEYDRALKASIEEVLAERARREICVKCGGGASLLAPDARLDFTGVMRALNVHPCANCGFVSLYIPDDLEVARQT